MYREVGPLEESVREATPEPVPVPSEELGTPSPSPEPAGSEGDEPDREGSVAKTLTIMTRSASKLAARAASATVSAARSGLSKSQSAVRSHAAEGEQQGIDIKCCALRALVLPVDEIPGIVMH